MILIAFSPTMCSSINKGRSEDAKCSSVGVRTALELFSCVGTFLPSRFGPPRLKDLCSRLPWDELEFSYADTKNLTLRGSPSHVSALPQFLFQLMTDTTDEPALLPLGHK